MRIPRVVYDTETRSDVDLKVRGLDVYAKHPSTEITCATVATDNFIGTASFIPSSKGRENLENEMRALGLNVVPPETLVAVLRAADRIVASNAPFDQVVTKHLLGVDIPHDRWSCTAARMRRHGLPGKLEHGATVLRLVEGKDKEGNRLNAQLRKPRPTWTKWQAGLSKRKEAGPKWFDDAKKQARNCAYNAADVRVSRLMDKAIPELEPDEYAIWLHVWKMNETGFPVDRDLINGAIAMAEESRRDVGERIAAFTGGAITKLNSTAQLSAWAERHGVFAASWAKDSIAEMLDDLTLPEPVRVVALARQEVGKGSIAKFETASEMMSPDGRLRYQVEYAGTSTLRLAGRGVQPLNLFRPKLEADKSAGLADIKAGRPLRIPEWKLRYDPEATLAAIRRGDLAALRQMGDPEEQMADHIRSMIHTVPGKRIVSPDLSAIEARGVFWLSGCSKALAAYRRKEDLYCQLASTITGFPVNKKDHPEERQLGKIGVLSAGYGSGASKLAMTNKIEESLALQIVSAYRREYHEVPAAWRELENTAIDAVCHPGYTFAACRERVHFVFEAGWLRMRRPSGTWMYLPEAGIDSEGRLFYHAWIKGGWRPESIWGGVLINFAVQGFCRELMYGAEMQLARDPRFELILQCYDSLTALVPECDADELCNEMIRVMTTPPAWALDFPLAAEGKPKMRYS